MQRKRVIVEWLETGTKSRELLIRGLVLLKQKVKDGGEGTIRGALVTLSN